MSATNEDCSPAPCSAWLLQAKDPFKGWETWGEAQTEAEAKAWKDRKETEPAIYCKMEYRIIEPNAKGDSQSPDQ